MGEVSLTLGSFQPVKVRLEPTDLRGQDLAGQPALRLPLKLQLAPAGPQQQAASQYALLRLAGKVSSASIGEFASFEADPLAEQSNPSHYDRQIDVVAPLNRLTVKRFEAARAGANAQLQISLLGLVWIPASQKFERIASGLLQVDVPKSHWVEEVVSRWGLSRVKVVEIEFPEASAGESYRAAYSHLEAAEKLLANGQYKQVLAEVYSAFEGLAKSHGFAKPDQSFFVGLLADMHDAKREKAKLALDNFCSFLHLGRHEPKQSPQTFQVSLSDARFALILARAMFEYICPKV